MSIQFVQEGDSIDYIPAADVAAGVGVVQKYLFGVTRSPIKAGELGALIIEGVFDVTKVTGAGEVFEAGEYVYFDPATQLAHPPSASGPGMVQIGYAIAEAGDTAAIVRVRSLV